MPSPLLTSKAGFRIDGSWERVKSSINSVGNLIAATVGSTLFMSIVTGSSYLAILIPGEMFQDLYKKFKLAPETLSRTLEDAGTCAVPIVPLSVVDLYGCHLGVPTVQYMPYAVLLRQRSSPRSMGVYRTLPGSRQRRGRGIKTR